MPEFDHPVIQNALKEAVGDETNPYWIFRKIFDYLREKMFYEMVGRSNTADPRYWQEEMVRALNIPLFTFQCAGLPGYRQDMLDPLWFAVIMPAWMTFYHRWVEVYLSNYGWVPINTSGGQHTSPRDQANYIGHLSHRYLITTESGGGSETMEWTYNSNEFWTTDPKTFVVSDHFAEWEPVKE